MYYVYILSLSNKKFYIGSTKNLNRVQTKFVSVQLNHDAQTVMKDGIEATIPEDTGYAENLHKSHSYAALGHIPTPFNPIKATI